MVANRNRQLINVLQFKKLWKRIHNPHTSYTEVSLEDVLFNMVEMCVEADDRDFPYIDKALLAMLAIEGTTPEGSVIINLQDFQPELEESDAKFIIKKLLDQNLIEKKSKGYDLVNSAFFDSVTEGLEDIENGRVKSHEEVKKVTETWIVGYTPICHICDRIKRLCEKDEIDRAVDIVFNSVDDILDLTNENNKMRYLTEYVDYLIKNELPYSVYLSFLMATATESFPKRAELRQFLWDKSVAEQGEEQTKRMIAGL